MFDRCYCKNTFFTRNVFRKCTLTANIVSRVNDNFILTHELTFATVHVSDDEDSFCDGPGMTVLRTNKIDLICTYNSKAVY